MKKLTESKLQEMWDAENISESSKEIVTINSPKPTLARFVRTSQWADKVEKVGKNSYSMDSMYSADFMNDVHEQLGIGMEEMESAHDMQLSNDEESALKKRIASMNEATGSSNALSFMTKENDRGSNMYRKLITDNRIEHKSGEEGEQSISSTDNSGTKYDAIGYNDIQFMKPSGKWYHEDDFAEKFINPGKSVLFIYDTMKLEKSDFLKNIEVHGNPSAIFDKKWIEDFNAIKSYVGTTNESIVEATGTFTVWVKDGEDNKAVQDELSKEEAEKVKKQYEDNSIKNKLGHVVTIKATPLEEGSDYAVIGKSTDPKKWNEMRMKAAQEIKAGKDIESINVTTGKIKYKDYFNNDMGDFKKELSKRTKETFGESKEGKDTMLNEGKYNLRIDGEISSDSAEDISRILELAGMSEQPAEMGMDDLGIDPIDEPMDMGMEEPMGAAMSVDDMEMPMDMDSEEVVADMNADVEDEAIIEPDLLMSSKSYDQIGDMRKSIDSIK